MHLFLHAGFVLDSVWGENVFLTSIDQTEALFHSEGRTEAKLYSQEGLYLNSEAQSQPGMKISIYMFTYGKYKPPAIRKWAFCQWKYGIIYCNLEYFIVFLIKKNHSRQVTEKNHNMKIFSHFFCRFLCQENGSELVKYGQPNDHWSPWQAMAPSAGFWAKGIMLSRWEGNAQLVPAAGSGRFLWQWERTFRNVYDKYSLHLSNQ